VTKVWRYIFKNVFFYLNIEFKNKIPVGVGVGNGSAVG